VQKLLYFCGEFVKKIMNKKTVLYIVEWGIAIAACGWLVWKMATYEDYAALGECLRSMGWSQWLALAACVALMPVNMALEAWRWRTLWNGEMSREQGSLNEPHTLNEPLTLNEAQRQVYYSKLAGLITPWRLGEYPARGVLMAEDGERLKVKGERNSESIWPKVLSMGAVGSATMTAAIVLAGIVGLMCSPAIFEWLGGSYLYSLLAAVVALGILFLLMPKALKRYAEVNQTLIWRSVGQSLVRLACWCVQLALVIWALGGLEILDIPEILGKSAIYYLLVTITPNVPIVEAGARGAWAMAVFGTMNAAFAGILLWVINTVFPCIIWPIMRKKR